MSTSGTNWGGALINVLQVARFAIDLLRATGSIGGADWRIAFGAGTVMEAPLVPLHHAVFMPAIWAGTRNGKVHAAIEIEFLFYDLKIFPAGALEYLPCNQVSGVADMIRH